MSRRRRLCSDLQCHGRKSVYLADDAVTRHHRTDPSGRAGWVNAMLGGMSEAQVVIDFMTAPEYTFRHPDAASFVTGLYTDILERAPDGTGFAFWVNILQNGSRTRAALVYYFLFVRPRPGKYWTVSGAVPDPGETPPAPADATPQP